MALAAEDKAKVQAVRDKVEAVKNEIRDSIAIRNAGGTNCHNVLLDVLKELDALLA